LLDVNTCTTSLRFPLLRIASVSPWIYITAIVGRLLQNFEAATGRRPRSAFRAARREELYDHLRTGTMARREHAAGVDDARSGLRLSLDASQFDRTARYNSRNGALWDAGIAWRWATQGLRSLLEAPQWLPVHVEARVAGAAWVQLGTIQITE